MEKLDNSNKFKVKSYSSTTTQETPVGILNSSSNQHQPDIFNTQSFLAEAASTNNNFGKFDDHHFDFDEINEDDSGDKYTNDKTCVETLQGNNDTKPKDSIIINNIDYKLGSDEDGGGLDSDSGGSDSETSSDKSVNNKNNTNKESDWVNIPVPKKYKQQIIEYLKILIKSDEANLSAYESIRMTSLRPSLTHDKYESKDFECRNCGTKMGTKVNNKHSNGISELELKEEESEVKEEKLENKDDNSDKIHHSGHMWKKKPRFLMLEKCRFFKLHWNGILTWWETSARNQQAVRIRRNTLNLSKCKYVRIIKCTDNKRFKLKIKEKTNKKMEERIFRCETSNERDEWIQKITEVCNNIQYEEEKLPKNSTYKINSLKYRQIFRKNLNKIHKSNLNDHELDTSIICSHLSSYVYNPTNELLDKLGFKEVYAEKQNKTTGLPSWGIFVDKNYRCGQKNDTTVYVVFRGTSIKQPKDCITDVSIGSKPFYFVKKTNMESMSLEQTEEEKIDVHGGMCSAMEHVYYEITKKLQKMQQKKYKFKKIVVTGHSLGGGIGTLFCLNLLKHKYLFNSNTVPSDFDLSLITFGAPSVIIPNKNLNKSKIGQKILNELLKISIHFVNNLDLVPRILVNDKWRSKMLIHGIDLKIPSMVKKAVKFLGFDSYTKKAVEFLSKIDDKYKPWGKFCFLQKNEILSLLNNLDTIEKVLNYHPPVMSNNEKLVHDFNDKKTCCLDSDGYEQILQDHKITSYIRTLKNYENSLVINEM